MGDAEEFLAGCEAETWAVLYKARWDEATATEIVPRLIDILRINHPELQCRALFALVKIGPLAWQAAPHILPLLRSDKSLVYESAAHALYCVSLRRPEPAIQPLIEMASMPGRKKFAMHALVGLGPGAKPAIPLFIRAFDDTTVYMRRLALRGLKEIGADRQELEPVLLRAKNDRSKEVQEYAAKLAALLTK